jgi:hypothetical protein
MSDSDTNVTDASAFQQRSLGKQVVFAIITLGIYRWSRRVPSGLDPEGEGRKLR